MTTHQEHALNAQRCVTNARSYEIAALAQSVLAIYALLEERLPPPVKSQEVVEEVA